MQQSLNELKIKTHTTTYIIAQPTTALQHVTISWTNTKINEQHGTVVLTQSIQTLFRELAALREGGKSTPVPANASQNCFNWQLSKNEMHKCDPRFAKDLMDIEFSSLDNPAKVFTVIGKL
jgi:hypothetical protein